MNIETLIEVRASFAKREISRMAEIARRDVSRILSHDKRSEGAKRGWQKRRARA